MGFADKKGTPAAKQTVTSTVKAPAASSKPAGKAPGGKGTSVRMTLPPALGSYVTVFQPKAIGESTDLKYSISLLWPKAEAKTTLAELRKNIVAVAVAKFGPSAELML